MSNMFTMLIVEHIKGRKIQPLVVARKSNKSSHLSFLSMKLENIFFKRSVLVNYDKTYTVTNCYLQGNW